MSSIICMPLNNCPVNVSDVIVLQTQECFLFLAVVFVLKPWFLNNIGKNILMSNPFPWNMKFSNANQPTFHFHSPVPYNLSNQRNLQGEKAHVHKQTQNFQDRSPSEQIQLQASVKICSISWHLEDISPSFSYPNAHTILPVSHCEPHTSDLVLALHVPLGLNA